MHTSPEKCTYAPLIAGEGLSGNRSRHAERGGSPGAGRPLAVPVPDPWPLGSHFVVDARSATPSGAFQRHSSTASTRLGLPGRGLAVSSVVGDEDARRTSVPATHRAPACPLPPARRGRACPNTKDASAPRPPPRAAVPDFGPGPRGNTDIPRPQRKKRGVSA